MKDDYLWDGSGEPDPEVQRLELLLGKLRHDRPAPEFPAPVREIRRSPPGARPHLAALAAAAAVVLLVAVVWFVLRQPKPAPEVATVKRQPKAAWEVASLEGAPKVGSNRIGETGRLPVGEWLETDGSSRARINVGMIGQVQVEPNTRIRLVEARITEHRLALARGTIHARIWAPPRLFFVETPSALAVDLGCRYTLKVDDAGAGLLRVITGWVALERNGRTSFVPAGAWCATKPGFGPGTPYLEDSSQVLRTALARLDFEQAGPQERVAALGAVLAESRKEDALTLWHLLSRVHGEERSRVYDRLAALVPPPPGVTRQGVLGGDQRMLDLWLNYYEPSRRVAQPTR